MAIRKKIDSSRFRPRPSHIPIPSVTRPEILFVCHSGSSAESLISLLKSADYSITHAESRFEALDWLARRRFRAMLLDCSIAEAEELRSEGESCGVPIIPVATTRSGVTAESVKAILGSIFKIAPLEWFRRRDPPTAA